MKDVVTTRNMAQAVAAMLPDPKPGMVMRMDAEVALAYAVIHNLEVEQVQEDRIEMRMRKPEQPATEDRSA